MATPRAPAAVRRARRRTVRRVRRFAVLTVLASVVLITLTLTAFGSGTPARMTAGALGPPSRLPPDTRPNAQIVAVRGSLRLQLPIAQGRVTAIGYHAAGSGALPLEPLGRQGNRGLLDRLADRIFGGGTGRLVYYHLSGGEGAHTAALDVGAAPDTDVFSPVDGTVVGITDFVLDARRRGVRIDIQPSAAPSLVVSLTRLRPDPALTVGSSVAAGRSRIGTVLDLSGVERQALARYTQDAGNHVTLEVHPAPTLALS